MAAPTGAVYLQTKLEKGQTDVERLAAIVKKQTEHRLNLLQALLKEFGEMELELKKYREAADFLIENGCDDCDARELRRLHREAIILRGYAKL